MFMELSPSRSIGRAACLSEVEIGYSFHGIITMDAEMVATDDHAIIDLILAHIESADGYKCCCLKVANPQKKHAIAFYLGCAQDQSIQSQVVQRQRLMRRMEILSLLWAHHRRNHRLMADIQHDIGHCGFTVVDTFVPMMAREYIRSNASRY